jgi:hypothetical protein
MAGSIPTASLLRRRLARIEMMEPIARDVMPHFREDAHVDETAGVGRRP